MHYFSFLTIFCCSLIFASSFHLFLSYSLQYFLRFSGHCMTGRLVESPWSSVGNLFLDGRASTMVLGFCAGRKPEFRYIPPPSQVPDNRNGDRDSSIRAVHAPRSYPHLTVQTLFSTLPKLQFCQHLCYLSSSSNQKWSIIRLNNSHYYIYNSVFNCVSVVHLTKPSATKIM
jgi:hypothetical protein